MVLWLFSGLCSGGARVLFWSKWQRVCFTSEYFGLHLSISFHHCFVRAVCVVDWTIKNVLYNIIFQFLLIPVIGLVSLIFL